MRIRINLALASICLGLALQGHAQTVAGTFPRGTLSSDSHHTGDIWLNELNVGDENFPSSIAQATYGPGARLNWHIHPAGQVLMITEGTGYYQEKGQPVRVVHKGDVIKSPAGVEHWHAAAPGSTFAYIAVTPTSKGKTIWLSPVSPEEYDRVKLR